MFVVYVLKYDLVAWFPQQFNPSNTGLVLNYYIVVTKTSNKQHHTNMNLVLSKDFTHSVVKIFIYVHI